MSLPKTTPTAVPLWSQGAPGALGTGPADIPTLTAFLPPTEKRNGASVLILPGGGYLQLTAHEGRDYAEWLAGHGVCCHVLHYRLGSAGYRHPCMIRDSARGLRVARAFARVENLETHRVGVIGSSAGGHLASTLLTRHDAGQPDADDPVERESSRPDFGILCYPVISAAVVPRQDSFDNLLGENPSTELLSQLSSELHVTADTPPTFIWHTVEDRVVPVENALLFASALRKAGVPFDLHLYEKGKHGLGLPSTNRNAPPWDVDCLFWLRQRGIIG